MRVLKSALIGLALGAATLVPALAQSPTPVGKWHDSYGTSFHIALCEDGASLCIVLDDIGGEMRTASNLKYVNTQVLQAAPRSDNEWKGHAVFAGGAVTATIKLVSADQIEATGCITILCSTLPFTRY